MSKQIPDSGTKSDQEYEDFELTPLRYRPEGLDQLSEATRFSKEELQFMYRGFKQECPTGVISEETFKQIYGKFFPVGGQPEDGTGRICPPDSAMYAHYVFGTMDQDGSGSITFGDFIMGLSVLLKGTLQERINWIFNLYDINNDGYITKEELIDIVTSIYDLMGDQTSPAIDDGTPIDHVERIFEKLDLNKDGVVTMDEFVEYCSKNENVIQSFNIFDEIQ
ncbi:calsenilin-like isoform X1 [Eriocheir sinensis]|uniref:calsenilin-like isoform X1 n=1 Tax=Eriocheir sinensis TaxID=95602 RepID=UPI0021C65D0B|nr:calsenilin-like isoform X1 [Eriocheir sinensis]